MFSSFYITSQILLTCDLKSFNYNKPNSKVYVGSCVLFLLLLDISFMLLFELELLLFG